MLPDGCSTLCLSTIWNLCMFKTWRPVLYSQHRPDDATKATTCYYSWHLVNKQILCNPGAVMSLYHSVPDGFHEKFLYFENQSSRNIFFFYTAGIEGPTPSNKASRLSWPQSPPAPPVRLRGVPKPAREAASPVCPGFYLRPPPGKTCPEQHFAQWCFPNR